MPMKDNLLFVRILFLTMNFTADSKMATEFLSLFVCICMYIPQKCLLIEIQSKKSRKAERITIDNFQITLFICFSFFQLFLIFVYRIFHQQEILSRLKDFSKLGRKLIIKNRKNDYTYEKSTLSLIASLICPIFVKKGFSLIMKKLPHESGMLRFFNRNS